MNALKWRIRRLGPRAWGVFEPGFAQFPIAVAESHPEAVFYHDVLRECNATTKRPPRRDYMTSLNILGREDLT